MLLNGGHPLLGVDTHITYPACVRGGKGGLGDGGGSPNVDLGACSLFPLCVAAALGGTTQWLGSRSQRIQRGGLPEPRAWPRTEVIHRLQRVA